MSTNLAWIALLAAGCGAGEIESSSGAARASWTLVADADLALRDPRCAGAACPSYPNPAECSSLTLEVDESGTICGRCAGLDGAPRICGGPAQGIPYRCFVERAGTGACTVCDDLFGATVLRDCSGSTGVATAGYALTSEDGYHEPPVGDEGTDAPPPTDQICYEARRADGTACQLCVDASRRLRYDDCTTPPDDGGSDGGDVPPEVPDDGMEAPPAGECPADGIAQGRRLFTDALNGILGEAGLPADYVPGGGDGDPAGAELIGERVRVQSSCRFGDFYEERVRSSGGWYRSGRPRCGYMVTVAVSRACRSLGADCAAFEEGIVREQARATRELDDRYDCISSPVVLDLDGDGVHTVSSGARFDFAGAGPRLPTTWIEPGDALLARDADGDGRIDDGTELFGETTRVGGGPAGDGFTALRPLDDNGDGRLDARDRAFGSLVVWQDDGDGRTDRGELRSLARAGVRSIDLRSTRSDAIDAHGSVLGLWSRFERDDGTYALACDVWFAAR